MRTLLFASLALLATVPVPAASAATRIPGIVSPSGNIRCLYVPPARGGGPVNLLCTIARSSYAKRLQQRCISPPTGLDWHGFRLGAARAGEVVCTGGILYDIGRQIPRYVTLPYGRTWQHGPFSCVSRRTGLTCRSRAGHGLFVSRESWRAW